METSWEVVDSRTGNVVGTFTSMTKATRSADRRDNEWGAVRFTVRQVKAVWTVESARRAKAFANNSMFD